MGKKRRHDTKPEMSSNFISDFSFFYIAFYFYLCMCLCICVSSRYIYADNCRKRCQIDLEVELHGYEGDGDWIGVLGTGCGSLELNVETKLRSFEEQQVLLTTGLSLQLLNFTPFYPII